MNRSRLEWKVGFFVAIAIAAGAGLIIRFSKGSAMFAKTFDVVMKTPNVGGLIPGAGVLMAGVKIGQVESTLLDSDGASVNVRLRIEQRYHIHKDALFSINQSGFLGDRFVAVEPTAGAGPELRDGDRVHCDAPFDLQQVARSAAVILGRMDEIAVKVNATIARVDQGILTDATLTNFASTLSNLRDASALGLNVLTGVDQFVRTNTHPLNTSVNNLVDFSEQLDGAAKQIGTVVSTNLSDVTLMIRNLGSMSDQANQLLSDLQQGRGLIGSLLKDDRLDRNFDMTIANLSILSSNLNRFGILWKPSAASSTFSMTNSIYPGKSPFRN